MAMGSVLILLDYHRIVMKAAQRVMVIVYVKEKTCHNCIIREM